MDTVKLEQEYLALYWQWHRCQWDNYFDDAHHDLSAIDQKIYTLVAPYYNKFKGDSRREKVLDALVLRILLEKDPEVAQLRNKLDNWDNYIEGSDAKQSGSRSNFYQRLGELTRDDLLKLIETRTRLARKYGFDSYPDLIFSVEELPISIVECVLQNQITNHLDEAKALAKKYRMKWSSWFKDLDAIGGKPNRGDNAELVNKLLLALGYEQLSGVIKVVVKEGAFPYAACSAPDDIRLINSPVASIDDEIGVYHELGHAISYALNQEQGIFKAWSNIFDETMGEFFEYIALEICYNAEQQRAVHEIMLLEHTREATSALFELALWKNPGNAEALYEKHYGAWEIEMMPSAVWAMDTFRSIDPVYIHNYVIAGKVGELTVAYLKKSFGKEYKKWGEWLKENYYRDGNKRNLLEKISVIGGLN